MFIAKKEIQLHALLKDPVARLLFLNALFVVLGYALANLTGKGLVGTVSDFKNGFLFLSFIYLIATGRVVSPGKFFDSGFIPIIFSVLILYVSIGSGTTSEGFFRTFTFFIPLLYIYLSLAYLIANFGTCTILTGLHWSLLLIYSIPLLFYLLSRGKITDTNIYGGGSEDQAFASNNYGWSATMYILSFLFVWRDITLKKFFKIFLTLLFPVAVILFFTSANRASWLSFAVAMIPFFFRYKGMHLKYKIMAILVTLGFISFLLADPNSSINFARTKSQKQERVGESRFATAQVMVDNFNKEPTLWITGVGMFNFTMLKNKDVLHGYHNSYYEILFGVGIILFLVFLSFMMFRPLIRYIKYYAKYTLLLPPLMILPFFESNLTGGQFLFFPWFTFMLLLNAKIKFWNRKTFQASIKQSNINYSYTEKGTAINETDHSIL